MSSRSRDSFLDIFPYPYASQCKRKLLSSAPYLSVVFISEMRTCRFFIRCCSQAYLGGLGLDKWLMYVCLLCKSAYKQEWGRYIKYNWRILHWYKRGRASITCFAYFRSKKKYTDTFYKWQKLTACKPQLKTIHGKTN